MREFCVIKTTVINVLAENPKKAEALAKLVNEKDEVIVPGTSIKTVDYQVLAVLSRSDVNKKF